MINLPKSIYGLHDKGGEYLLKNGGYVVITTELGHDPNNYSSENFSIGNGIEYIVRLNNGYSTAGTIPLEEYYASFAKRCVNYVLNTNARFFIIGNEINLQWEWPNNEIITIEKYIKCYNLCYDAIKAVKPDVFIAPAPVGNWNTSIKYKGNERGDWCKLQLDILTALKDKTDFIAIHAYAHDHKVSCIYSEEKMQGDFTDRYYHFKTYIDMLNHIPQTLKHLPVFITEANGDVEWKNENNGFLQALYAEINWWNTNNSQQILCACIYRWPCKHDSIDRGLECKNGVIEDFKQAVSKQYKHQYNPNNNTVTQTINNNIFSTAIYSTTNLMNLNVRLEPNTSSAIIEKILFNTKLLGIEKSYDDEWIKCVSLDLKYNFTGWIKQEFLLKINDCIVPFNLLNKFNSKLICVDKLNLRDAPTTKSNIITQLVNNETILILSTEYNNDNYNWIQVFSIKNNVIGYIAASINDKKTYKDIEKTDILALDIDKKIIDTVKAIESNGEGLNKFNIPVLRFEAHIFKKYLNNDELFNKYFRLIDNLTHEVYYNNEWLSYHNNQSNEYTALLEAIKINREYAYKSASFGMFQIMGFHYEQFGYNSAEQMFLDFYTEEVQNEKFFYFIKNNECLYTSLRDKDFFKFAELYNGNRELYGNRLIAKYKELE